MRTARGSFVANDASAPALQRTLDLIDARTAPGRADPGAALRRRHLLHGRPAPGHLRGDVPARACSTRAPTSAARSRGWKTRGVRLTALSSRDFSGFGFRASSAVDYNRLLGELDRGRSQTDRHASATSTSRSPAATPPPPSRSTNAAEAGLGRQAQRQHLVACGATRSCRSTKRWRSRPAASGRWRAPRARPRRSRRRRGPAQRALDAAQGREVGRRHRAAAGQVLEDLQRAHRLGQRRAPVRDQAGVGGVDQRASPASRGTGPGRSHVGLAPAAPGARGRRAGRRGRPSPAGQARATARDGLDVEARVEGADVEEARAGQVASNQSGGAAGSSHSPGSTPLGTTALGPSGAIRSMIVAVTAQTRSPRARSARRPPGRRAASGGRRGGRPSRRWRAG